MLSILRMLMSSPDTSPEEPGDKIFLAKLLLTSRPHLKELIENEFQVKSVSLVPISIKQQADYFFVEMNRIIIDGEQENKTWKKMIFSNVFPRPISRRTIKKMCEKEFSSGQDLLSNPLMLKLYAEIVSAHFFKES